MNSRVHILSTIDLEDDLNRIVCRRDLLFPWKWIQYPVEKNAVELKIRQSFDLWFCGFDKWFY